MTDAPLMRITSIDLDDNELPHTVSVKMTWPVWDRLCRDGKAIRDIAVADGERWWFDRFPAVWVAKTAEFYGQLPLSDDGVTYEVYSCLASLCNRFWDRGVHEALTSRTDVHGAARHGWARQGQVWLGDAGRGWEGLGSDVPGGVGQDEGDRDGRQADAGVQALGAHARPGWVGRGAAWQGLARRGLAR